jgi:hypothetical protein
MPGCGATGVSRSFDRELRAAICCDMRRPRHGCRAAVRPSRAKAARRPHLVIGRHGRLLDALAAARQRQHRFLHGIARRACDEPGPHVLLSNANPQHITHHTHITHKWDSEPSSVAVCLGRQAAQSCTQCSPAAGLPGCSGRMTASCASTLAACSRAACSREARTPQTERSDTSNAAQHHGGAAALWWAGRQDGAWLVGG